MIKLGISVYPDIQRFAEIADYIRLASSYGFKLVFSSMWSVEGSGDEVVEYFRKLAATVHENGMVLDLDV
ncbi:MAG: DUF871 family protein, partial [Erysipelotrichaceae bacterium]|nr:DUF871 family protein [Erysipelotrichaceae bacterium]